MAGPSSTTIKRLFAVSGNRCAFPACANSLFDQNGTLIADVCHIAGDKPSAKRYDPTQTETQRRGFNNLIALCANHHRVIDADAVTFTRPTLRKMKQVHEASATEEFVISDRQAEKIVIFLGGAVAATAFGEIVSEVADFVRTIYDVIPKSKLGSDAEATNRGPPLSLLDTLRYAPLGAFQVLGTDEPHQRLGEFFKEVFEVAGWRLENRMGLELNHSPTAQHLMLLFILRNRHQVSNAQKAIGEVFEMCGFEGDGGGTISKDNSGHLLQIRFVVTSQR